MSNTIMKLLANGEKDRGKKTFLNVLSQITTQDHSYNWRRLNLRKTKLNTMAMSAKTSEIALWQLKAECWPMIERVYESTWSRTHKIARIEMECERELENAVRDYDPRAGDFEAFVKRKLYRARLRILKETSRLKRKIEFIDVDEVDVYDDYDGVATVEVQIDLNKRISRMAAGDPRRKMALKAWSLGFTDISDLARRMTKTLGTSFESNRKFLTRFKYECRLEFKEFEHAV